HRSLTRQMVRIARNLLLSLSKTGILRDVESRQVRFGNGAGHARQLTVREVRNPIHSTEASPSGDLRVEIHLRILGQPHSQKQSGGQGHITLRVIIKTPCSLIGRAKGSMVLSDRGSL